MPRTVSASEFISLSGEMPVIDVRSESEFAKGHIPGAINIPLFNDDERAVVGTLYTKSGREASVIRGLELTGPKLAGFVKQLHKITNKKQLLVHCWRGGMRSGSMAWLFEQTGYEVMVLEGGYKAYRHFIHEFFSIPWKMMIIGGKTGSGKTDILQVLQRAGDQVLDLEKIAFHKGSAFGGRTDGYQPTNEQFYNDLGAELAKADISKFVWIEDESRNIGKVSLPDEFFNQMILAPVIRIEESREKRISRLVNEYSTLPYEYLAECLEKISEKIGGTRMNEATEALRNGDYARVVEISLDYYDKAYEHSISQHKGQIIPFETPGSPDEVAAQLISLRKKYPDVTDIS